jgi:hypothetical protein
MHRGFTPTEIDAMSLRDVRLFMYSLPTVRELLGLS